MRWRILALAGACLAIPGSVKAQGGVERLSKVELLALQQEMRDRGCGNRHAPGVIIAETRRALRNCMRQHNVTTARDLLTAFNIGFGPDERAGLTGRGEPTRASELMDTDPNTPGVQHDETPGMRRGIEGTQPGQTRTAGGEGATPKKATPKKKTY